MAAEEALYLTWLGYEIGELQRHYLAQYGAYPLRATFFDAADGFERLRGGLAADVVHPCAADVPAWREAGLLRPIEVGRLSQWPKLHPKLRSISSGQGKSDQYFIPWEWGEISIVYRPDLVRLGPSGESWTMLWDEQYRGRIALLDSPTDVWNIAALAADVSINAGHPVDGDKLLRLLNMIAGNAGMVSSDPDLLAGGLATGEIVAAVGWASLALGAAKRGVPIRFARPREGSLIWTCGFILGRTGRHLNKAYSLIDGMLRADVGALCLERFRYGHSNLDAFLQVSDAALAEAGLPRNPTTLLNAGCVATAPPLAMRSKLAVLWESVRLTKGRDVSSALCACAGPKALQAEAHRSRRVPGLPPT
jgi:spermidine/putrescine transport system substrate-binding protein